MSIDSILMPELAKLEQRTGSRWENIRAAGRASVEMRARLENGLAQFPTKDSSIVVVGSLARHEFTKGSDVDWLLLLDGLADPEHMAVTQEISRTIAELTKTKPPGPEGSFGTFCSSHELIQQIGGQGDTNTNTTRRMLLLLESIAIGRGEAHQRVFNNVLYRYLNEDRGLWFGSSPDKVPRFLFNDISRYWHTMAVDFSYKQRTRPGGDFALRNFKLRVSRKLIYLAGMVACFECHLAFRTSEERADFYATKPVQPVIDLVRNILSMPPLEIIARAFLRYPQLDDQSKIFFDSYDDFLRMLADPEVRAALEKLPVDNLESDLAKEYRGVAHRYMEAIETVFLQPSNELGRLTIKYGVF